MSVVTVVLPFVPVMATSGVVRNREGEFEFAEDRDPRAGAASTRMGFAG